MILYENLMELLNDIVEYSTSSLIVNEESEIIIDTLFDIKSISIKNIKQHIEEFNKLKGIKYEKKSKNN